MLHLDGIVQVFYFPPWSVGQNENGFIKVVYAASIPGAVEDLPVDEYEWLDMQEWESRLAGTDEEAQGREKEDLLHVLRLAAQTDHQMAPVDLIAMEFEALKAL